MPLILLTEKDTGTSFDLLDSCIYEVILDPLTPFTGSKVLYGDVIYNGWTGTRFVTQTPAAVAAMCEDLILVTAIATSGNISTYINKNQIVSVLDDSATGGSTINYFSNGSTARPLSVTQTAAQVRILVQAEEDEDKTPVYTDIAAGGVTLTAAQVSTGGLRTTLGPYTLTLPTATLLAAAIGATEGSSFTLKVNNDASGIVTLVLGAGMTAGITMSLTVAASVQSEYRLVFQSTTACMISQIV